MQVVQCCKYSLPTNFSTRAVIDSPAQSQTGVCTPTLFCDIMKVRRETKPSIAKSGYGAC